jgi:hypothetical protein
LGFPAGAARPTSCPWWHFPQDKVTETWPWLVTSIQFLGEECVNLHLHMWAANAIFLPHSLVSHVYIDVITMTFVVKWMRLVVCNGPSRVCVPLPSPEEGNISSFRNFVFSSFFRIPDDRQNPETQWLWVLYTVVETL